MGVERVAKFCDDDRAFRAGVFSGVAEGVFAPGNGFATRGPEICGDVAGEIRRRVNAAGNSSWPRRIEIFATGRWNR